MSKKIPTKHLSELYGDYAYYQFNETSSVETSRLYAKHKKKLKKETSKARRRLVDHDE